MTDDNLRQIVLECLAEIAPEADVASVRGDEALREQLDIDSMDFLNFVIAMHERTGVDFPEGDYGSLSTIDDCAAYLASHPAPRPGG